MDATNNDHPQISSRPRNEDTQYRRKKDITDMSNRGERSFGYEATLVQEQEHRTTRKESCEEQMPLLPANPNRICGEMFEHQWPRHRRIASSPTGTGKTQCATCGEMTDRLWQHKCKMASPKVRSHPCPTCGVMFQRLWQHKCKTASPSGRAQPCPTCGLIVERLWQHKCKGLPCEVSETVRMGERKATDEKGDARLQNEKESQLLINEQGKNTIKLQLLAEKQDRGHMDTHFLVNKRKELQAAILDQKKLEVKLQQAIMEREKHGVQLKQAVTENERHVVQLQQANTEHNLEVELQQAIAKHNNLVAEMWCVIDEQEQNTRLLRNLTDQRKELETMLQRVMQRKQHILKSQNAVDEQKKLELELGKLETKTVITELEQLERQIYETEMGPTSAEEMVQMKTKQGMQMLDSREAMMSGKKAEVSQGSETKVHGELPVAPAMEQVTTCANEQNRGRALTLSSAGSPGNSNEQPSFSKRWQFSARFSRSGGTLQGESSDVTLDVPQAAITTGTIIIKGAVSTDLDRVHKELGLRHDERIVSPVIEYFAGQDFVFGKPVQVTIPHFAPEQSTHGSISVYRFHKEDSRLRVQKLNMEYDADNTYQDHLSKETFRFSGRDLIEVLINHFCGFVCTHCGETSPELQLRLYGSLCGEHLREVNVFLLVWDQRLNIKDFRENLVPKSEEDKKYMLCKSLEAPEDTAGIDIAAFLVLERPYSEVWTHKLRENGKPWFPATQKIDLKRYQPSCPKSSAKRLDWLLEVRPDQKPGAVFRCFIDVGYIAAEDQGFQLLDSSNRVTLHLTCLELPPENVHVKCTTRRRAVATRIPAGSFDRHSSTLPSPDGNSVSGQERCQAIEPPYSLPLPGTQVNGNHRRPQSLQRTDTKQAFAESSEGASSGQRRVPTMITHGTFPVYPTSGHGNNRDNVNGSCSSPPESEGQHGTLTRLTSSTQGQALHDEVCHPDHSTMRNTPSAALPVRSHSQGASSAGQTNNANYPLTQFPYTSLPYTGNVLQRQHRHASPRQSASSPQGTFKAYTVNHFVNQPHYSINIGKVQSRNGNVEFAPQPGMPANTPSSRPQTDLHALNNNESSTGMAELQGHLMDEARSPFPGALGDLQDETLQNAIRGMSFNCDPGHGEMRRTARVPSEQQFRHGDCYDQAASEHQGAAGGFPFSAPVECSQDVPSSGLPQACME